MSGCPTDAVPIEADTNGGANCAHWDELCLRRELMTGFVALDMPISRVTVAGLADLGYTVDYGAADEYNVSNLDPSCVCDANGQRQSDRRLDMSDSIRNGTTLLTAIETPSETANPDAYRRRRRRRLSDKGRAKAETVGLNVLRERIVGVDIAGVKVLRSVTVLYEEDSHVHGVYVSLDD